MAILKKINAEWALRLSLGIMYLYSGIDIVRHPNAWSWAIKDLPSSISNVINNFGVENFLRFQGAGEIILAVVLLSWFLPRFLVKWAGLLSAVEMTLITLLVGINGITFRDIGLIGSGLALYLLLCKEQAGLNK